METVTALQALAFAISITCLETLPVLVQTPVAVAVLRGQTVTITCAMQNNKTENNYIRWFHQLPGQETKMLVQLMPDNKIVRGPNITTRFVPSRDVSAKSNSYFLTISDVAEEDSSKYYCSMWLPGKLGIIWGNGTWLHVLAKPPTAPSVALYAPLEEELSAGSGTISCLARGFYPESITVLWSLNGSFTSRGVSTGPALSQANKMFSVASYLHVTANEWSSGSLYSCLVQHHSTDTIIQKPISARACTV
nr:PREDICTED: Ig heavy chain Mem5-like [Latimeria chalumnae]|eukprot:XP_006009926.2 PREDICTED: Ig heavy chain Mem5-like [Latimeria chalumnae]